MKILCLSASNNEPARRNSASTRTCELIAGLLQDSGSPGEFQVEIVPLIDYNLKPCVMCGGCFNTFQCQRDSDFNSLMDRLISSDGFFLVVPHYALIPSKVLILFEKFQEMVFLNYSHNPNHRFGLYDKPVGLVVHGGQTSEALPYYREALLKPLAAIASASTLKVIDVNPNLPGAVFGINSIQYPAGQVFCQIEHDWQAIREAILPLVRAFQTSLMN